MMSILRNKGLAYRKVGFPHHYALEVYVNDQWYYFDPNMEPRMKLQDRTHDTWAGINDNLKSYYSPIIHHNLDYQFGNGQKAEFGSINEIPARNASFSSRPRPLHPASPGYFRLSWLLRVAASHSCMPLGRSTAGWCTVSPATIHITAKPYFGDRSPNLIPCLLRFKASCPRWARPSLPS